MDQGTRLFPLFLTDWRYIALERKTTFGLQRLDMYRDSLPNLIV